MATYVKIAAVDDVPADGMRSFAYQDRRIALYRIGETIYATDAICSHEDADLTEGWLDPDDCTVECPLHGSRFDLRSGRPLGLPAFQPVDVYPVRVDGAEVYVEL